MPSNGQPDNHQRDSSDSHTKHRMENRIARNLAQELQNIMENLSVKPKTIMREEINSFRMNAGAEQATTTETKDLETITY
ncbi:hypothetical protein ANN_17715 [Periplaneta americana]|uniref:Uncharacterized protein n=1 Tax=Periplaneta americana TaxID=6978 RepID=A0ABQ8SV11_PERAM|nr:hypothetical protein ANN_17715 [Periplaneta americana]